MKKGRKHMENTKRILKRIQESRYLDPWGNKFVTGAICLYEVFSISTRKTPALTEVMHRHPWLKPVFVGTLAWHLMNEKK